MVTNKIALAVAAGALMAVLGLVGCSSAPAPSNTASSAQQAATTTSAATTSAAPAATTESKSSATTTTTTTETTAAPTTLQEVIGDEAAKQAALAHAGVAAADCTAMKVELDMNDNPPHYDVDFKAGGMEYDYDINPTTGEVISFGSEVDD